MVWPIRTEDSQCSGRGGEGYVKVQNCLLSNKHNSTDFRHFGCLE